MGNWVSQQRKREIKRSMLGEGGWCNCHYCGKRLTYDSLTIDHKVPRALGGRNTMNNMVPSCLPCNEMKGTQSYRAFVWRLTA